MFIIVRYVPTGLVGKYKSTPNVASVLAGPMINRVLFTKTRIKLISMAIDAFKTFLNIGKGICCMFINDTSTSNLLLESCSVVVSFTNDYVSLIQYTYLYHRRFTPFE